MAFQASHNRIIGSELKIGIKLIPFFNNKSISSEISIDQQAKYTECLKMTEFSDFIKIKLYLIEDYLIEVSQNIILNIICLQNLQNIDFNGKVFIFISFEFKNHKYNL